MTANEIKTKQAEVAEAIAEIKKAYPRSVVLQRRQGLGNLTHRVELLAVLLVEAEAAEAAEANEAARKAAIAERAASTEHRNADGSTDFLSLLGFE